MKTLEVPDHLFDALSAMVETFVRKGQDYSTSDDAWASNFHATSEHFGIHPWEAADFNEVQKLARLSALRHRGKSPSNEAVTDTYQDKAVYALIAYALLLHHTAIAHPSGEGEYAVVVGPPATVLGGGGGSGAPGPSHGGPRG
jgi:hypothetical protein